MMWDTEKSKILQKMSLILRFIFIRSLVPGWSNLQNQDVLTASLKRKGYRVKSEVPVSFQFDGMQFSNTLRMDLLINEVLVIELKSVENLQKIHSKPLP